MNIEEIMLKLGSKQKPMALFYRKVDGEVRMTKDGTELFKRAVSDGNFVLVGFYDMNCKKEWLIGDIEYVKRGWKKFQRG